MKSDDNLYEKYCLCTIYKSAKPDSMGFEDRLRRCNLLMPDTWGTSIEFTYAQTQNSALISLNVTRLYKSTDDPCNTEEIAKKSYEFDTSKDATVVITTNGESAFIANQAWEL